MIVGCSPATAVHATQCILHRLATLISDDNFEGISQVLKLVMEVVRSSKRQEETVHQIKQLLFVESREIQVLCRSGVSASALQSVVNVLLDTSDDGDRALVAAHCDFWADRCSRDLNYSQVSDTSP